MDAQVPARSPGHSGGVGRRPQVRTGASDGGELHHGSGVRRLRAVWVRTSCGFCSRESPSVDFVGGSSKLRVQAGFVMRLGTQQHLCFSTASHANLRRPSVQQLVGVQKSALGLAVGRSGCLCTQRTWFHVRAFLGPLFETGVRDGP